MTTADTNIEARKADTVADLLKTHERYPHTVPLHIRFWLERYVECGEKEMHSYGLILESPALEIARLVYDVLQSKYLDTGEHEFSEAARDDIEVYLYRLASDADVQVWNYPEAAVASLVALLDCANSGGPEESEHIALSTAINALTTRRERRHFLKTEGEGDESKDDRDWRAARKLSRLMADPNTPEKVRRDLGRRGVS